MSHKNRELWQKTYAAGCDSALKEAYQCWAKEYDKDTVEHMGYVAPMLSSKLLDSCLESKRSEILDVGAGSGLVGEALKCLGYSRMDALDLSQDMLDVAKDKNVYEKLICANLSEPLKIEDNSYDAIICVGTFTYGHVSADALDELTRITRPSGYLCFTVRDGIYQEYGFDTKLESMTGQKLLEEVSVQEVPYLEKENVKSMLCAYQVC